MGFMKDVGAIDKGFLGHGGDMEFVEGNSADFSRGLLATIY